MAQEIPEEIDFKRDERNKIHKEMNWLNALGSVGLWVCLCECLLRSSSVVDYVATAT